MKKSRKKSQKSKLKKTSEDSRSLLKSTRNSINEASNSFSRPKDTINMSPSKEFPLNGYQTKNMNLCHQTLNSSMKDMLDTRPMVMEQTICQDIPAFSQTLEVNH